MINVKKVKKIVLSIIVLTVLFVGFGGVDVLANAVNVLKANKEHIVKVDSLKLTKVIDKKNKLTIYMLDGHKVGGAVSVLSDEGEKITKDFFIITTEAKAFRNSKTYVGIDSDNGNIITIMD